MSFFSLLTSHFSFWNFDFFLLLCFGYFVDVIRYFRERSERQRSCYVNWWQRNGNNIYLDELVFIDESSFDSRSADRNYGYGLSGERVGAPVGAVRGQRYTALAGICLEGVIGFRLIES